MPYASIGAVSELVRAHNWCVRRIAQPNKPVASGRISTPTIGHLLFWAQPQASPDIPLWLERRPPPSPPTQAASARSLSFWHPCSH